MKKQKTATLKTSQIGFLLGISNDEAKNLLRSEGVPLVIQNGVTRVPEVLFRDWYEYRFLGGAA